MAHKTYYQTAASEVADGTIDTALWTKVNVDFVGTTDDVRQAKYIQLRAQELSIENAKRGIARFVPRTWWQWARIPLGIVLIMYVIAMVRG